MHTFQNRAGAICTYAYTDGRNRCTSYSWSQGTATTNQSALATNYYYFANGQLKETVNNTADIQFTYDDSGALKSETERPGWLTTGRTTTYTHDADGNVDSITYPSDPNPRVFTYDSQQRCVGASYLGNVYGTYTYPNQGNWLRCRQLGNGVYTQFDYQANGRVKDLWHINAAANKNISLRAYGYAPNGQLSWYVRGDDSTRPGGLTPSGSSLENGFGDAYYYYPERQLLYFSPELQRGRRRVAGRVQRHGGQPGGLQPPWCQPGRATRPPTTTTRTTTGRAPDRSHPVQPRKGYTDNAAPSRREPIRERLDLRPRRQHDQRDNGVELHLRRGNHLTSASGPGGVSLLFGYDPLGRLFTQTANGVGTIFYYAGSQRIEEHDLYTDSLRLLYMFDAPGSDGLLLSYNAVSGQVAWYLRDALGNTTHLCDNSGQVIEQYLYDAWGTPTVYDGAGNVRAGGSAYDNRYLFKGAGAYEWLTQAQIYYCRARFYLPQHGRWLQPDPIGQAGGLNVYAYCGNDPVNGIDSSGLAETDDNLQDHSHPPGLTTYTGSHIPGKLDGDKFSLDILSEWRRERWEYRVWY